MDPITAATTLAPLVIGAFRKKKKGPNRNAIIDRYRKSRPTGYTTPEDEAFAERQRTRATTAARAVAERRRQENARQVAARGLSGPAAAALEQDATAVEAQGGEEAARTSADLLYRAYNSNLGYERSKEDAIFGSEMGLAAQEAQQNQARDATFWNSVLEAAPAIASAWSPKAPAGVGSATTAAPAAAGSTYAPTTAPVTPAQRQVQSGKQYPYR